MVLGTLYDALMRSGRACGHPLAETQQPAHIGRLLLADGLLGVMWPLASMPNAKC
jgi:hypothetical protein